MGKDTSGQSGGFNFGNIHGGVKQRAGGDIVGGNKIAHYHQLPADQQNQLQSDLASLRDQFKTLADAIATNGAASTHEFRQLQTEIATRLAEFDKIKGALESKSASKLQAEQPNIDRYLTEADETLKKIGTITMETTSFAGTVGSIIRQTLPYLTAVRELLGF